MKGLEGRWLALQVAAYLLINWCLNAGNKFLMTGLFPYPILVIMIGLLASAALSWLVTRFERRGLHEQTGESGAHPMTWTWSMHGACFVVGCLHGAGTACQNISLHETSMSLNQIVKCMSPAVTMALSFLVLQRRYHWVLVLLTLLIIAFSCLTTYTTPTLSHLGFWTGVASCVLNGGEGIVVEWAFVKHGVSVSSVQGLTSAWAFVVLIGPLFLFEPAAAYHLDVLWSNSSATMLLCGLTFMAFLYQLFHYSIIRNTDAHYTNLLGSFKVASLVLFSMVFMEDSLRKLSPLNIAGTVGTLVAFFAYSVAKKQLP